MRNQPPRRVLFITYINPWNPRYGGAHRCYGVIEGLAERSDLHVAFAGSNRQDIEAFLSWPSPAGVTRHVLSPGSGWDGIDDRDAGRTVRAVLGKGKYAVAFHRLVQELRPDIIWYYEVEALRRTGLTHEARSILDHDNVRWRRSLRQARVENGLNSTRLIIKSALLRLDDVWLSRQTDHSLVCSPEEQSLLWPAKSVLVLPNSFNFPQTLSPSSPESHRLLFYGSLFYRPNADGVRWFVRAIWPLIKKVCPEAQLDIAGLGHEALSDLAGAPDVTFHGFVDDLDNMIRQAAALVVPLRVAGGTRIKIIEAWAKGLPVVSTTIGAEGLSSRTGEGVLLADTAEEFAGACVKVLSDPILRSQLVEDGFEGGRSRFDWPVIHRAMDELPGISENVPGPRHHRSVTN